MKDILFNYLQNLSDSLSIQNIFLNFLVAMALGLLIYISYKYSHSGAMYSARFNTSLVMLTIVTTLVMAVIGNNISLSLGMVGALSIVRFRTAIKDPRDTTYIFWCIAVGICCGVSEYIIALIGSMFIFLFLLVFGSVKANDRYLLVVHADKFIDEEIESIINSAFSSKAVIRVKNTTRDRVEFIYELSQRMIEKTQKRNISITALLYGLTGVESVNIISQNEEVSR